MRVDSKIQMGGCWLLVHLSVLSLVQLAAQVVVFYEADALLRAAMRRYKLALPVSSSFV